MKTSFIYNFETTKDPLAGWKYGAAQWSIAKNIFYVPIFGPLGVVAWCEDRVERAAEAKADFVARSVNSHGELLAAQKLAEKHLDDLICSRTLDSTRGEFFTVRGVRDNLSAAIAKADGRTA